MIAYAPTQDQTFQKIKHPALKDLTYILAGSSNPKHISTREKPTLWYPPNDNTNPIQLEIAAFPHTHNRPRKP